MFHCAVIYKDDDRWGLESVQAPSRHWLGDTQGLNQHWIVG